MTLSERFFDHIGNFSKTAQQLVHAIIDELHKPIFERQFTPMQKVSDEHTVFLDEEEFLQSNPTTRTLFYAIGNMCIKITHQGE
jgi:hypothetical protein